MTVPSGRASGPMMSAAIWLLILLSPPEAGAASTGRLSVQEGDADSAGAGSQVRRSVVKKADASGHVKSIQGLKTEKDADTTLRDQKDMVAPALSERDEPTDWGHGLQISLRAAYFGGYVMDVRYADSSPYCVTTAGGTPNQDTRTCGFLGPGFIDAALGMALTDSLEPYLWGRFGMSDTAQTNSQAVRLVGAGLRFYAMPESRFKIFLGPAIGVNLAGEANEPNFQGPYSGQNYQPDVMLNLNVGPQFELFRMLGIYGQVGATMGFVRSFTISAEFGAGLQLRTP